MVLAWAGLVAVGILTKPLIPLDETRYVAVAWEMWQRGDLLVPHLNGLAYSHKPPLLFWLIHALWSVTGPNALAARVIAPVAALVTLLLTVRLAGALWPRHTSMRDGGAGLVLIGTVYWAGYQSLTMFDILVALWTVVGISALVRAADGARGGFMVFGLAIGLGVLTKGPVILVYLLAPALSAPWWSPKPLGARWYPGILGALALGAALALMWALPAAAAGGPDYAEALLWRQSAGRVVDSFAHRRAWWWYLAITPVVLLPWSLWPAPWRGIGALLKRGAPDHGLRLLGAWLLPTLVVLSVISGKQPHYLIPLLPAAALLIARGLDAAPAAGRGERALLALALVALGVAWLSAPFVEPGRAWWLPVLAPGWALLPATAALAWWRSAPRTARELLPLGAAIGLAIALLGGLGIVRPVAPAYDPRPVAQRIANLQRAGSEVAHLGKYHGQYHFYGRLERPLTVVHPGQLRPRATAHPAAWPRVYPRVGGEAPAGAYQQRYRGRWVVLGPAAAMATLLESRTAGD